MKVLKDLQPAKVFEFFEEMSEIPHGSYNTKAVSDWCVDFAKKRGLEYYQDDANNVIIIKPATEGYENSAPVIMQGHLDMVCEKAPGCDKDMEKEGLDLFIDGDLIGAKGTTLGGDDGIAVAMALAVLDSDDIKHPRLEAVFTTDEEVGMLGAEKLDVSPLKGKMLLNADSEEEGVLTVSCAGGNRTRIILPVEYESGDGTPLIVKVSGLIGGHSGIEINKGRANASVLMARTLFAVQEAGGIHLVKVNGGLKDNAIPNECTALITVDDKDAALKAIAECDAAFKAEYGTADAGVKVDAADAELPDKQMTEATTDKVIFMLMCLPNGVQEMSQDIKGLVQTSLNLGILETTDAGVEASYCIRSSVGTQKQMLVNRIKALAKQLGARVDITGDYPGWQYLKDSKLRDTMKAVYEKQYGKEPVIEAVHAGLECGLFADKIPGLDCVSFGPNMTDIHTARERMSISSVQRTWNLVLGVLEALK